jgi:Uma2 family endonuclease
MVQQVTLPPLVRGEWIPMTSEEFDRWLPDDVQGEWVRGKGIAFVSNSDRHQWTVSLLYDLLDRFAKLHDLGRTINLLYEMWLPDQGSRRQPDVLYVAPENLYRWEAKRLIGAADFASEIVSDDSVKRDYEEKFEEFRLADVREYLSIDNREGHRFRFDYYRLGADGRYHPVEPDEDGRYHSEVLPGFWLDPRWFATDPLPDSLTLLSQVAPEAFRRELLRMLSMTSGAE